MDPYNPHRPNPQQGYSPYQAYPGFNQPNNTYNMNPNNVGAPRSYGTYTTQSFPQNTLQPSAYASNVSTNTGNSQQNVTYTSFSPNPPPRSYQVPEGAVLDLPEIWELEEEWSSNVLEQLSSPPPPSTGNMPVSNNTNNRFTILPTGNFPTPTSPPKPPEKKERIYIILNGRESSVEVPSNLNGAQLVQTIKKTLSEPVKSLSIPSKGIWEGKDREHAKYSYQICPETSKYQVKGDTLCVKAGTVSYCLYESHGWMSINEIKSAGIYGFVQINKFIRQYFERYFPAEAAIYCRSHDSGLFASGLVEASPSYYTYSHSSEEVYKYLPRPEYHRDLQEFDERIDNLRYEFKDTSFYKVIVDQREGKNVWCRVSVNGSQVPKH